MLKRMIDCFRYNKCFICEKRNDTVRKHFIAYPWGGVEAISFAHLSCIERVVNFPDTWNDSVLITVKDIKRSEKLYTELRDKNIQAVKEIANA